MRGHVGTAKGPGWVRRVTTHLHEFALDHTKSRRVKREKVDDAIDEAGRESFPASDPPAWTLGVERRDHDHDKDP